MPTLRSKLIRLAHENPELRPHLLPLVRKKAGGKSLDEYLKPGFMAFHKAVGMGIAKRMKGRADTSELGKASDYGGFMHVVDILFRDPKTGNAVVLSLDELILNETSLLDWAYEEGDSELALFDVPPEALKKGMTGKGGPIIDVPPVKFNFFFDGPDSVAAKFVKNTEMAMKQLGYVPAY